MNNTFATPIISSNVAIGTGTLSFTSPPAQSAGIYIYSILNYNLFVKQYYSVFAFMAYISDKTCKFTCKLILCFILTDIQTRSYSTRASTLPSMGAIFSAGSVCVHILLLMLLCNFRHAHMADAQPHDGLSILLLQFSIHLLQFWNRG